MAANQRYGTFSLDQLEGGFVGNQKIHVLLMVSPSPHGADGGDDLALVVALALHLDDRDLVLLGGGHQDGTLDQKTMAGLDTGVISVVIIVISRIFWSPDMLLVSSSQSTRPKVLFLNIVTSYVSHDKSEDLC